MVEEVGIEVLSTATDTFKANSRAISNHILVVWGSTALSTQLPGNNEKSNQKWHGGDEELRSGPIATIHYQRRRTKWRKCLSSYISKYVCLNHISYHHQRS